MRVLYLNPFSQEVSGPDESLRTLLSALIPLGVEPHVALPRPGPQVARYSALGVTVHFAPLTSLTRRPGPGALLLPFRVFRGAAAVARIARAERIALIHTNMETVLDGAIAAQILRIPHVLHYRGNTSDRPKFVFHLLTRFWTSTAHTVFCISDSTADIFRVRGIGAKVTTLYNPVDIEAYSQATRSVAVRRGLGARADELLLGTVARIHPRKDIATFLRAGALVAQRRPDVRLVVVGAAEAKEERRYEQEMHTLASALGLTERLVWAGPRRDIPAVLKALDVFVLCSRNEGFGRVVAEAIAAETAMVLSAEGALPEIASGVPRAALATPASPHEFAEGILRVAASAPSSGGAAPEAMSRFDPRMLAARVFSTYKTACRLLQ